MRRMKLLLLLGALAITACSAPPQTRTITQGDGDTAGGDTTGGDGTDGGTTGGDTGGDSTDGDTTGGDGDTTGGDTAGSDTAGGAAPGIGEVCGDADACATGLTCVTYYGIAGARGPAFKSCEVPCPGGKGACPAGTACTTIADGPGQVCR